jgi:hypothetical protein
MPLFKLTKETAQQIIYDYIDGGTFTGIAKQYGVGQGCVRAIILGCNWKNLIRPPELYQIDRQKRRWHDFYNKPPLTERQKSIVIGSMLGDGSLHRDRGYGNSLFEKKQCLKHKEYLDWHIDEFGVYAKPLSDVFMDVNIAEHNHRIVAIPCERYLQGYKFETITNPVWSQLELIWYKRNGDGSYVLDNNGRRIKIIPSSLVELDDLALAVWFCDDGTNWVKTRRGWLFTQSFSINEAERLVVILSNLGIRSKIIKKLSHYTNDFQPVIVFRGDGYDNLLCRIRPYMIWDCFDSKRAHRPAKTVRKITPNG